MNKIQEGLAVSVVLTVVVISSFIMVDQPQAQEWYESPFTPINLDIYVNDAEDSDGEITWTTYGNDELMVDIDESRIATLYMPFENWYGIDNITFRATDTGGLYDEDWAVFSRLPSSMSIGLAQGWNLMSLPTLNITTISDTYIIWNETLYSWQDAVDNILVYQNVYMWNGDEYLTAEIFYPAYGYWLYAHKVGLTLLY